MLKKVRIFNAIVGARAEALLTTPNTQCSNFPSYSQLPNLSKSEECSGEESQLQQNTMDSDLSINFTGAINKVPIGTFPSV